MAIVVVLAQHLLEKPGPDKHRLDLAFQQALLRPARTEELDSIWRFLAEELRYYRKHSDEAALLIHVGLSPLPVRVDPVILAALLGIDYKRLCVKFKGLEARLTGIAGNPVKALVS